MRKVHYGYMAVAVVAIAVVVILGWLYFSDKKSNQFAYATYFTYTPAELAPLQKLSSSKTISLDELTRIDQITYQLIRTNKLGDAYAARVFVYLYSAQRDLADLSMQLTGKYSGSVDAISSKVLCLFFTNQCQNNKLDAFSYTEDPYSEALATVVFNQYQQRYEKDKASTHLYPEKVGPQYWAGVRPYFAQEVGSWMLWRVPSLKELMASPPPMDAAFWQKQLQITKDARANATPEQTKAVVAWAGGPGSMTPPGMWIQLANDYMKQQKVPLSKVLQVRAILAMSVTDACIVVFNSKYTYWIKRPNMHDLSIITIMPTPNHPSYPAGHSTISGAAEAVLEYYFPENKVAWQKAAYEAANSRVWGGIHFTVDSEVGLALGQKVGQAAVNGK